MTRETRSRYSAGAENVDHSRSPFQPTEDGNDPQSSEVIFPIEHMICEGSNNRSSQAACSCGVQRQPAAKGSPIREVALGDRRAGESGDHEAEVAGMGGAHDGASRHNGGHIGREDPRLFEEARGEAEEGADTRGGRGY